MGDKNSTVWDEKYRPDTVAECILPERIKQVFLKYVEQGKVPTVLILGGSPGIGKTSIARALLNDLNADSLFIPASSEGNIDTVRTDMTRFASTVSIYGGPKITILDEADGLSASAQQALRNFCDENASHHSTILTCNYKNKIIDAMKSRGGEVVDFRPTREEKKRMMAEFAVRLADILRKEGVEFDSLDTLLELVKLRFPDFRKILIVTQRYAMVFGKIDAGILAKGNLDIDDFNLVVDALKRKQFTDMRKWVADHSDDDQTMIYRRFYDMAPTFMEEKSVAALVLILGQYSYRAAFVADPEINMAACFTEVMTDPNIRWLP